MSDVAIRIRGLGKRYVIGAREAQQDLPLVDGGAAKHLQGAEVPDIALPATDGSQVSLGKIAGSETESSMVP